MKKVLCLLLIILLLSSLFIVYFEKTSNAAYSSKFDSYPGYKELLEDLQRDHPNWEFEIFETGLSWETVLNAETVARHGRSLISKYDKVFNKCPTCGNKQYEPGWYCASTAAVAYYLDPRNSLCEDYIFQFEQLTYDSKNQNKDGVEKILSDCNYMQGKISYYDAAGNKQNIDKTYIDVIMEASEAYNVSPYHLASRIRQELGTGDGSAMASGTWHEKDENGKSYEGYYNYYNWGAYGDNIMLNGLKTAKKYGWTDPEKAIKGGAQLLAQNYISKGQDTLYLQKFDIVDGGDGFYGHQYMTNISASKEEGLTVKNAYLKMGMLTKESKIKFRIPVYKNMPTSKAAAPGKETIVTQDVQINADKVKIFKEKNSTSEEIATLDQNTKILRIELADQKDSSNIYWDKVVLSNGVKGYVQRTYLTQISLQSNCNEKYVVINQLELRNGPGKTGTEIIKYISAGQMITAVEKEKYTSLDGENWYRVKLTDGECGYVAKGTTDNPNMVIYDDTSTEYGYIKVICTWGLNIRTAPTTNANNIITTLTTGTKLFRIQKNASNNEGYVWDRVVTSSGIVGYAVRQDKETGQQWVREVSENYDIDDEKSNITCIPELSVSKLKSLSSNVVVKKGDTVIKDEDKIGTGYTITVDGKTYTAVVKGDTNGDAAITSSDYVRIKNYLRKKEKLSDAEDAGADVNGDGDVTSADYVKVKNYLRKKETITIN